MASDWNEFEERLLWPAIAPFTTYNDPQLPSYWHLVGASGATKGANVTNVWDEFRGTGVIVGAIDDGVEHTHPDLGAHYGFGLDFDFRDNDSDAYPSSSSDRHGTAVGGVIGAALDNGINGAGVAPEATLVGYRIGFGAAYTGAMLQAAFEGLAELDVANNSWGFDGFLGDNFDYDFAPMAAGLYDALETGRDGLGTVVVFSAGNSRAQGQDTNYHNFQNDRGLITVAATNSAGAVASFSTPGDSILVAAPGQNILTTDRVGALGYTGSDFATLSGTSFSAPIVSGVAALMLDANPGLGWRDVQEILASTAIQVGSPPTPWSYNHADNWNGGAMHVSRDVGFGLVDAMAAVRVAESWHDVATSANEMVFANQAAPNAAIPDVGTLQSALVVPDGLRIDHVEVDLYLQHDNTAQLKVVLTSPTGTQSVLWNNAPASVYFIDFTFSTTHDWGESSGGAWTLSLIDSAAGAGGTLLDWAIRLYGDLAGNDTYLYTEEFGPLGAADAARRTFVDASGIDSINAAAIVSATTIDLRSGFASLIDGQSVTIGAGTIIENADTGDGNDTLIGNDADNWLRGWRGNDTMTGGLGNDTYGVDSLADVIIEYAGEGMDTVQSSITYSLAAVANLENLTLTGAGAIDAIGNDGDNVLTGNSAINTLTGGAGNDSYHVGPGDVVVEAAAGGTDTVFSADTYTLGAELENLTLTGSSAIDGTGNASDNVLTGNSAANVLDGGAGVDTLIGGAGNDSYVVDSTSDTITENAGGGTDTVQSSVTYSIAAAVHLENVTLTGANAIDATGNAGDNVLTGNSALNVLAGGAGNDTYVVDGTTDTIVENAGQGTDTVQSSATYSIATAANLENVTLTGAAAINATGNGGNNVLSGNSGDNVLDGGSGADTLIGGLGNDAYVVDNASDAVTENPGAGTDTVQSSVTYSIAAAANVENLTLTGTGVINATGNDGNNVLTGNSANNVLNGGAGVDTLIGGLGNDTYVVDNASDTIAENAGEGIDTVQSSLTYSIATAANLENVTLIGAGAINATGNSGNNVLTGNSAANVLDGGAGTDILIGGAGNDTYVVDNASDTIVENAGEGTDTVQSSVTYSMATAANLENITLTGAGAIDATGNAGSNVLTGNSAANVLAGGAGNDTYVVDASDTIAENAGEGTDTVQSSVSYSIAAAANLENVTLTGTGAANATGNSGNNTLTGNSAGNILDGGAGTDILIGGAGNDTYVVDSTTDTITEAAAQGTDTVQSSVTYSIATAANLENITLIGAGAINATGNGGNNVLTGNSGNNILDGGAGTDILIGGLGNDSYVVDSTTDTITETAGQGTDTVQSSVTYSIATAANLENITLIGAGAINATGNSGANVLTGNSAGNVLDGGGGADTLIGGAGNDTHVVDSPGDAVSENAGEGTDTVQSSITYALGANVENLTLTGTAAINATGNGLSNVLIGNSAGNTLTGGAGADTLDGGAGNDLYMFAAGSGQDVIADHDATAGNQDVVRFASGIAAASIAVSRSGLDLRLDGSVDGITVQNWFASVADKIEQVEFADATVWNVAQLRSKSNLAPTVANQIADQAGSENAAFSFQVPGNAFDDADLAIGAIGETLTYSAALAGGGGLPAWLSFNASTRTFTGTPPGGSAGTIGLTVTATDSQGAFASDVFDLSVTGGSGSTINGTAGNDTLNGTAGNDTINGLAGNDTLNGLEGNDTLNGGAGNDTMNGGGGDDVFEITGTSANYDVVNGGAGIDVIRGGEGDDTFRLWSYSGANTVDRIEGGAGENVIAAHTYNTVLDLSGTVLVDIAQINGGAGHDTITGSAGNDVISGGAGNDTMNGGAGDDVFVITGTSASYDVVNGGAGIDIIQGGDGDDTFRFLSYSGTNTVERIEGGTGENVIAVHTNNTVLDLSGTLLVDIARITGNAGNDTITGGAGNDVIAGGGGNDILNGGAGNDSLDGGTGTDTMNGGTGDDSYTVDQAADLVVENAAAGSDTVSASISYALGANVENLTLTGAGAINATGNAFANILTGNSAGNTLTGGAGADTLDGGAGNDLYMFAAGFGQDVLSDHDIAAGNQDVVRFGSGIAATSIGVSRSGSNLLLSGSTDGITVLNWFASAAHKIERVELADATVWNVAQLRAMSNLAPTVANAIADQPVTESAAFSFQVPGNAFDDADLAIVGIGETLTYSATLAGGGGLPSWLAFDGLTRTFSGTHPGGSTATIGLRVTATDSQGAIAFDLFDLTITPGGSSIIDGTPGDDTLNGTAGNDTINGLAGHDTLNGLGGNDTLDGGPGNDVLDGGAGIDALNGGEGDDIYVVDSTTDTITDNLGGTDTVQSSVTYSIAADAMLENVTLTGAGAIDATGNSGANVLTGNSAGNVLDGGAGADTLDGGAGNDLYMFAAGSGQDVIADHDATAGNQDVVRFASGIAAASIAVSRSGLDLRLDGSVDGITVQNWFASVADKIEQVEFADATVWNVAQLRSKSNLAPTVANQIADQAGSENAAFSFQVPGNAFDDADLAIGAIGETLTYSAALAGGGGLPAWLSFNASTRTFTGTPPGGSAGTIGLTVTATDSQGAFASDVFDLSVTGGSGSTINGTAGNDTLNGTAGNDTINGLAGNDTLNGLEGNDTLNGGAGNDTMNGGGGDDVFEITGTSANYDVVNGGAGIDVIRGGEGDDTFRLWSYSGANTVDRIEGGAGENVIAAHTYNTVLDLSGTVLVDIAQINGGAGHDTITGSAGNDVISGGAGNDTMNGGAGDDVFVITGTSASYDVVNGGAGIDIIQGGDGDDTFRFLSYSGTNTVERIEGGTGENVIAVHTNNTVLDLSGTLLVDIARITGNAGNDTITGGAGNDVIAGGGGNDILNGGAGNDSLDGGTGTDTMNGGTGDDSYTVDQAADLVVENAAAGSDTVNASLSYTLPANVEVLNLAGIGAINATGNALANALNGNSAANTLDGRGGTDTLFGGPGDDIFAFQKGEAAGDAVLDFAGNGAAAGDSLRLSGFGAGATLSQSGTSDSWVISYGAQSETIQLLGVTTLSPTDYLFV